LIAGWDDLKRLNASEVEVSYLSMAASLHHLTEPAIRGAISALHLPAGSRGLDAGCGVGDHTLWLAEAVSPDGHVTGIDISRDCLHRARAISSGADIGNQLALLRADMNRLPFVDNAFDWAWSADALWIGAKSLGFPSERPWPVINELTRVVKPGGVLALLFWSNQLLLPGYPLLEGRLDATRAANYPIAEDSAPEMHIMRTLGWLHAAGLKKPKALTLVANAQAPLNDIDRDALAASFQMLWGKAQSELTADDWEGFQRLCQPESPDFILNLPDYYGFITYTLFCGRVPDLR
jgi:SAM-dependent methyltransferase